ncbi:MAG: branched-chain amino acid ABC transporter permease [Firmicutes bacterium]|nr:branched-chain amino acid ABC transporter permease [Bacillota bacterium]
MKEEKRITDNSLFRFVTVILIPAVILAVVQFGVSSYYTTVFILFMINLILAAGLNLTNGITGIFSLGMAVFMGIGAYVSSLLTLEPEMKQVRIMGIPQWLAQLHMPLLPAVIIAGIIAMALAAGVGFVILRAKGHYLAVITLGLVIVIKNLLDNLTDITNGAKGISGMQQYSTLPVVTLAALLILFVLYRIQRSTFGRSMRALRDDESAAVSLGINYLKIRLMSFMISAFIGAVGGALWAHMMRAIAPSMFYFDETFNILEISVIGGMSTLSGAVPGAMIMTFLPQVLSGFETGFTLFGLQIPQITGMSSMITSILFILVITIRKGGVIRSSEYIVTALFDPGTWTGLVKKETYLDLGRLAGDLAGRSAEKIRSYFSKENYQ